MWRLATLAAAARSSATALAIRSANAVADPALRASASALPSFLSPPLARHGSSFSQSPRASRASSRASGNTYRKPKGREGDKNPWHQKESMPDIPTFAEARLPPHIRRKLAAAARVKASHNSAAGAGSALIDFEVVDDEVQRIKGKDSRRPEIKRTKSPLHRAIKLEAARAQALRNKQAADASALEWDPSEQEAAESEADSFVALQSLREEIALQREIMVADMQQQGLSEEDAAKALQEFDAEAAQAIEDAEAANLAADASPESTDSTDAAAEADATTAAPAKRTRKPREKKAPAPPTFGVQTLLSFLAEYDFAVQLPDTPAAAATSRGRKKRSAAASASTDLVASSAPASSDADPSSRESLLRNPLNQSVLVYDVASRFSFADFIVVVKTNSARQMRHIAEASYKMVREDGSGERGNARVTNRDEKIEASCADESIFPLCSPPLTSCLSVSLCPFPLSSVPFPERLSL